MLQGDYYNISYEFMSTSIAGNDSFETSRRWKQLPESYVLRNSDVICSCLHQFPSLISKGFLGRDGHLFLFGGLERHKHIIKERTRPAQQALENSIH
jgi:hypothetical protein